jgi:hypothetical protein
MSERWRQVRGFVSTLPVWGQISLFLAGVLAVVSAAEFLRGNEGDGARWAFCAICATIVACFGYRDDAE